MLVSSMLVLDFRGSNTVITQPIHNNNNAIGASFAQLNLRRTRDRAIHFHYACLDLM